MAITQNTYTGDGTTVLFTIAFPYLERDHVKASLNGTPTTAFTFANSNTIQFNVAPANGVTILLFRETESGELQNQFFPNSSIPSSSLNNNFTQGLYVAQETDNTSNQALSDAQNAVTTANGAVVTANAADAKSDQAILDSAAAVVTANTAESNSLAAVSTANAASSAASAAVSTANSASSAASSAVSTANAASATATQASIDAAAAVVTANQADADATQALSTANQADSNASAAVSTANQAAIDAAAAVVTAGTAESNSLSAISTANSAAAAVSAAVLYQPVIDLAALALLTPADGEFFELQDSTGADTDPSITGIPVGLVGAAGLTFRLRYDDPPGEYVFLGYFANDSETRYAVKATEQAASDAQADATQALSDAAAAQATADAALPAAGGTLTGDVTLSNQSDLRFGEATSNGTNYVAFQAPASIATDVTWTLPNADGTIGQVLSTDGSATLSWATAAGGGASVTTSDTAPSTPTDGDLWYDSVGGRLYVYYEDPNTSQWVDAAPQGGGDAGFSKLEVGNTKAEVIDTGSDGRFVVTTEGTERARIDSSGRLLVGTNTASGNNVLQVNTDALINGLTVGRGAGSISSNVAVGNGTAAAITTGSNNTAIGANALDAMTIGANAVAIGNNAFGAFNRTGDSSTPGVAIGSGAGSAVTTAYNNTIIGVDAATSFTTGLFGVYIGQSTTASAGGATDEMVIGTRGGTGKGNNTGFINPNGGGVFQGNNSSSWSTTSDRRLKKNISDNTEGLDVINQVRVVNFEYKFPEEIEEAEFKSQALVKRNEDDEITGLQGVKLGVIAQELQEICSECVRTESSGVLSVVDDNLFWHLINAVKELSAQNASLEARLTALEGGN
jgi:hypothetical protein